MGSSTRPRGRLPRRVYWVRRGIVLGLALLLVFGIGRLVGVGSDEAATAVEAGIATAVVPEEPEPSATLGPVAPPKKLRIKRSQVPLLPPSGECRDAEVSVLPSVEKAWVGHKVVIRLLLQGTQPACTFEVSPSSLVVKVTSGDDRIWSSQDCNRAVPRREVVVRSSQPVEVPVVWNGRRSDTECTPGNAWALPGFYHAHAAAFGSTPSEVQFEVTRPDALVVTKTPEPRPKSAGEPRSRKGASAATEPRPGAEPSAKP